ncbi:hypothetical protein GLE_2873 [Lysobacter enzymogenes]|uniref:Uncharacterized protein n=1 Tax=Lysobacter enzymogenes TaxID=69 RepID=A0A0S2DIK0_LYSEN|nr:hypothetical protein GLE_2873 [Lysobacter enzymogenes]
MSCDRRGIPDVATAESGCAAFAPGNRRSPPGHRKFARAASG